MQKRILGRTGWPVSVISFGAIKLPRIGMKEGEILLNRALDMGINFVDTADCYGDSEEKIGQALKKRRKEFYLSTKVDERDGPGVRKKLERCLRRLQTTWIDLLLFHDVRGSEYDKIFMEGGLEELEKAREEGKIRHVGISIHGSLSMMKRAVESGAFSVLMVAYSAIDEDRLTADLLPMAAAKRVGLIAMKPLAGGRLAQFPSRGWDSRFFKGESPAQIALRYVLSNPHITCAIPGMTTLEELEENIVVGKVLRELSPEEIKEFMEKAGDAGKGFCRSCGYCLPCPEGVPIPDVFRFESYYLHYDLKNWARSQYASLSINAEACSECQQCLDQCPYGVSIPSGLKNAHKILKSIPVKS
ncbi:MAG: aldo/keto reductase [Deltaproteobacteria bacterium]|nr:aldo/keto reductase [Deltaproteobacteria bacterium]